MMALEAHEIKTEKSAELFCRLCFTERDDYRLIFGDECLTLLERIENLTTLKIINFPKAPASLCIECDTTLQNFESFRDMCLSNDRVIREMFSHDNLMNIENNASSDTQIEARLVEPDQKEYLSSNCLDSKPNLQLQNDDITIEYPQIKVEDVSIVETNDNENLKNKKLNPKTKAMKLKNGRKKNEFICPVCDKVFAYKQSWQGHLRTHNQEIPCKCKECGKSYNTRSQLSAHMRIHTSLRPYSCDRCESKFSRYAHLIRHKKAHLKKDLLIAKIKADAQEEVVQDDMKSDSLREPVKATRKRKKHCTICNKYVTQLSAHLNIHLETRPYQCEYCPKGFNQLSQCVQHTRTHTNEKPFACSHCEKAFSSKYALKMHVRIHTQERPYKCKECKKTFRTPNTLKQHKLIHSGLKPYSCGVCEAKFSQRAHLWRHKQSHSKKKDTNVKLQLTPEASSSDATEVQQH